ncbi:MAG: hypothetical protein IT237_08720, partial [Bacteroidia bacterium]|nr:hypothetical protein [Bacteroidia bacterium]
SEDKKVLYGDNLKTKIWDPDIDNGINCGAYVDYDSNKHGDIRNANTMSSALYGAVSGADRVILQGEALDELKEDNDLKRFESNLLKEAKEKKSSFERTSSRPIYFGGNPSGNASMLTQGIVTLTSFAYLPAPAALLTSYALFPETWNLAARPATWVVGRNYVNAQVDVSANGVIQIKYSLVEAKLDLKPDKDKSLAYKLVATPLSIIWPGNQNLIINAAWKKTYK